MFTTLFVVCSALLYFIRTFQCELCCRKNYFIFINTEWRVQPPLPEFRTYFDGQPLDKFGWNEFFASLLDEHKCNVQLTFEKSFLAQFDEKERLVSKCSTVLCCDDVLRYWLDHTHGVGIPIPIPIPGIPMLFRVGIPIPISYPLKKYTHTHTHNGYGILKNGYGYSVWRPSFDVAILVMSRYRYYIYNAISILCDNRYRCDTDIAQWCDILISLRRKFRNDKVF